VPELTPSAFDVGHLFAQQAHVATSYLNCCSLITLHGIRQHDWLTRPLPSARTVQCTAGSCSQLYKQLIFQHVAQRRGCRQACRGAVQLHAPGAASCCTAPDDTDTASVSHAVLHAVQHARKCEYTDYTRALPNCSITRSTCLASCAAAAKSHPRVVLYTACRLLGPDAQQQAQLPCLHHRKALHMLCQG
jgi:hypothetical protein